jgi:hypothetical protein
MSRRGWLIPGARRYLGQAWRAVSGTGVAGCIRDGVAACIRDGRGGVTGQDSQVNGEERDDGHRSAWI